MSEAELVEALARDESGDYREGACIRRAARLGRALALWNPLQEMHHSMISCINFLVNPPHFHEQMKLRALLVAEILMRAA